MWIAYPRRLGVVASAALIMASVGSVFAPTVSAALALGGGAGIIVDGTYCTLNSIGHDKSGNLVGFTAASCGVPDSPVVAEGSENLGPVGIVVALANDPGLKYSVIKFDPAKITPIANFAGFVINGIGPDPQRGQPECRLGAATGDFCSQNSTLSDSNPRMSMPGGSYAPGDNGGPLTSDGVLVGLIFTGTYIHAGLDLPIAPGWTTHSVKFSRILDDANSTGGPGAGFAPIGS